MARRIHFDKGFFGTDIGEISDDGRILFPDGIWGHRVVGFFEEDGIYIPDGLTRKKVIDIYSDGSLHLTADKGLFHKGSKIGKIDPDGTLRSVEGRRVGELAELDGSHSTDVVGKAIGASVSPASTYRGGGGGDMVSAGGAGIVVAIPAIALAMITPVGAVVLFPALLGSSSISLTSKIQLVVLAAVATVVAALVGALSKKRPLKFTENLPDMIRISWVACNVLNIIISVLTAPEPLGFFDWLLLVVFGSLMCVGWGAAASIIAFVILKLFLPKA